MGIWCRHGFKGGCGQFYICESKPWKWYRPSVGMGLRFDAGRFA